MSKGGDSSSEILEKIHAEIQRTNEKLDSNTERIHREIQRTNEKLDSNTERLEHGLEQLREHTARRFDLLTEAATRTNTELVGVRKQIAKLDKTVGRNGQRFEHALLTQGEAHRSLEARVARLEQHTGLEP